MRSAKCWGGVAGWGLSLGQQFGRGGCRLSVADPDEDFAILIRSYLLPFDEFVFEHVQLLIVQLKLHLQNAVRNPSLLLQQLADLFQNLKDIHCVDDAPIFLSA